ncbi:hypothetical protein ACOMHN_029121 [Nucella lapillus]
MSTRQSTLFSSFDRTAAATRNRYGTPKRGRSKERRSPRGGDRTKCRDGKRNRALLAPRWRTLRSVLVRIR